METVVMAANIEAFNRCSTTVSKRSHPIIIINACVTGYSNGYAEECKYKYTTTMLSCFQYAIRYKNEPVKGFPFTSSIR